MTTTRHLTNFISIWIISLLNMILPIIIILCLGRFYSIEEFGNYSVAASFMSAVAVIVTFGLGNVISFEVAAIDSKDKGKIANMLFSGIIALSVFSVIGILVILGLLYVLKYNAVIVHLILILGIGYWFIGATLVLNGVFMGLKEMHIPAICACSVVASAVFSVIPSLYFHCPLWVVALTWSLSQVVGSMFSLWFLGRERFLIKPTVEKKKVTLIIKRSLGIGFDSVISRFGSNLTMILLPVYLTSYQIGIFSGAFKPFVLFTFAGECVMRFFSPYIAGVRYVSKEKIEEYLAIMHRLVAFFTLTVVVLPIFFSNSLINLVFGEKLLASAPYMMLLAFGYLIFYLPPQSPPLMALGLEWNVIWCSIIRFIINLIGIILLVPKFGIMGAVMSINIAFLSYWIVTLFLYVKEKLRAVENVASYFIFAAVTFSSGFMIREWISEGLVGVLLFLIVSLLFSLLFYWGKPERVLVASYIARVKKMSRFSIS